MALGFKLYLQTKHYNDSNIFDYFSSNIFIYRLLIQFELLFYRCYKLKFIDKYARINKFILAYFLKL